MLNSVYSALKSLLRPPLELFNHDRSPADSLTGKHCFSLLLTVTLIQTTVFRSCIAVLSSKIEGMEIDKVLLHLEVKEFTVEPSTLIDRKSVV